jgi:hypothetical protein
VNVPESTLSGDVHGLALELALSALGKRVF